MLDNLLGPLHGTFWLIYDILFLQVAADLESSRQKLSESSTDHARVSAAHRAETDKADRTAQEVSPVLAMTAACGSVFAVALSDCCSRSPSRYYGDAQNMLLWRGKTGPAQICLIGAAHNVTITTICAHRHSPGVIACLAISLYTITGCLHTSRRSLACQEHCYTSLVSCFGAQLFCDCRRL